MPDNTQSTKRAQSRNYLAYAVLGFSVLAIILLTWKAIDVDEKNAFTISQRRLTRGCPFSLTTITGIRL